AEIHAHEPDVWSAATSRRCQPSSGLASPVRSDRQDWTVCRFLAALILAMTFRTSRQVSIRRLVCATSLSGRTLPLPGYAQNLTSSCSAHSRSAPPDLFFSPTHM